MIALALFLTLGRTHGSSSSKPKEKGKKEGAAAAAVPVVAIRARRGDIGVYFTGLGAVTPLNTVDVRTRVDGELMEVKYREGDLVSKGSLLAQIDPRPYQVALDQTQAQLARDQAILQNARTDLARYETLAPQHAIPEQQLATQKATVAQDEGVVKADEAQVANAKLNLDYTRIAAPLSGRVGLRLVDPGNMVHAADANGLVVITQIQPISVIFTVSEDQLQQVLKSRANGQGLRVDAFDREMKNRIAQGTLTTIDNVIDQTTGTVRIRATFDNPDNRLFPNQFVNAHLLVQQKRNVVLLGSAAIQRSSNQTYVYVVKPDSTVTMRTVSVGVTEGEDSEITNGLADGEQVVLTGVDKLVEGSRVHAQDAAQQGQQGAGRGGRGGARNQETAPGTHP
jgi:membrane fusion protein, multidrug efflux system